MKTLVAFCSDISETLIANNTSSEIKVEIGTLADDKTPRSWSLSSFDEPKNSSGGCFYRIWASQYQNEAPFVLGGYYGKEIYYGKSNDYEHFAKALRLIEKKMQKIENERGASSDQAEEVGRWLESCGVKSVMIRPEKEFNEWMNKGTWNTVSIGSFVNRIRAKFPKAELAQIPYQATA